MSSAEDLTGEEKKSDEVDAAGDETKDEEGDEAKTGDEAKDDAAGDDVKQSTAGSESKKSGTDVEKGKSQAGGQSSIEGSARGSLDDGTEKKSESKRSSTASGGNQKRSTQQEGKRTSVDISPKQSKSDKQTSTLSKESESKVGPTEKSAAESVAAGRESDGRKTTSKETKTSETETSRKKSSPRTSNLSDMEDYQKSPRDSDDRPSKLDLDTRRSEAPKGKNRQPRRYSARSAEPQSMVVGRIRKAGPNEYAENRKRLMLGESEVEEEDKRQHIAPLSLHTMEELTQKPQTFLPPSTTSMLGRQKVATKSYGSKMLNVDEFKLGGTRMSTLTDFLRRKQVGSRMRAMSREMQALRDQVHPDGRPTLYEEYSQLSEQRVRDLAQHFTPEQMMEYRDAFYNFDDDLDGFIPIGEVPYLMRALCQNPTEEELYDWISEVDIDALGSIDFADFLTIMYKKKEYNPIGFEEVLGAFKVFDNHNNGLLCAKELVYLMTTFGETLSEEEMEDMLREVSINDDYEVTYEEFVKRMTEC